MNDEPRDLRLSKTLSWLLRHGAVKHGIQLEYGGFVDVEKVLELPEFREYSVHDIRNVVQMNDKRRFALRTNETTGQLQIRANQGHSLPVNESGLLTELTKPEDFPKKIVHGTYKKNLQNIMNVGLSRMNRNHIHFAAGLPGDEGVVSGVRNNCDVFIIVDALKAWTSCGIRFYRSENNVILTPGDENGLIRPVYFKQVLQKSATGQLQ